MRTSFCTKHPSVPTSTVPTPVNCACVHHHTVFNVFTFALVRLSYFSLAVFFPSLFEMEKWVREERVIVRYLFKRCRTYSVKYVFGHKCYVNCKIVARMWKRLPAQNNLRRRWENRLYLRCYILIDQPKRCLHVALFRLIYALQCHPKVMCANCVHRQCVYVLSTLATLPLIYTLIATSHKQSP